ncbi:hypothetical protein SLEP1_g27668 [Rubroshorea leprosula]|uniref:Uncharacterized protein n=1 Tax=Rubroshorea leprosula TaxID=152421 RepID=A0AAV5K1X7_9ROSI|nr:hypothetical protein SLEP1_g27668 [Rubroshorea leprosula]
MNVYIKIYIYAIWVMKINKIKVINIAFWDWSGTIEKGLSM